MAPVQQRSINLICELLYPWQVRYMTCRSQYTVEIPKHFRSKLHVGQQVVISVDAHDRLILTPIEQAHEILDETFGLWADRTDIPKGGIRYMDKIRRGHRLKDLGIRKK